MRVLLIKTSSMGDIIHTLPALTDAAKAIPGIEFDWVVEAPFAVIPEWHAAVRNIIPVELRQWRKSIFSRETRTAFKALRRQLQSETYDVVLDAQGLVKSAFLTFLAKGKRIGLDRQSAREALASFAYQRKCKVNFYQHAIVRMRSLLSQALHYALPDAPPDFGLDKQSFLQSNPDAPYFVFLHGTTWTSKQWPETYWIELANLAAKEGHRIKMSGGNLLELQRAERIAKACPSVDVLPCLDIAGMAALLSKAQGVVAVDTGFGHLSAALGVRTVSLYGATHPDYTGAFGERSIHLAADFPCAPCLSRTCSYRKPSEAKPACYESLTPARVWAAMSF